MLYGHFPTLSHCRARVYSVQSHTKIVDLDFRSQNITPKREIIVLAIEYTA